MLNIPYRWIRIVLKTEQFPLLISFKTAFLISLFLCFNSFLHAQSRASFFGYVSDQFGNLPGATISIEGTNITTTTDVNGYYSMDVEEGEYVVNASFVMYTTSSKSITLKVGDEVETNFILETGFSIDQPVSLGSRDKPQSLLQTTGSR